MRSSERLPLGRYLPIALVVFGLVCLVWVGVALVREHRFQQSQSRALDRAMEEPPPTAEAPVPRPEPGGLIGRLEIPRIALSAMVVEGDDEKTLDRAVGHLPDTALPWEAGNSALAGHRDSFFRPLKDVRVGDEVRLTSPHGTFVYRVTEAFVTVPTDVGVLDSRGKAEITLVTCYPFNYVGAAPKRFIVRAEREARMSARDAPLETPGNPPSSAIE
jgi:sortase A